MEDELQLVTTGDGSPSVFSSRFGQHYHSVFGAVTESRVVFIRNGLQFFLSNSNLLFTPDKPLRIFEMGFGTGLNALLTFSEISILKIPVRYTAVEAYPLPDAMAEKFLPWGIYPNTLEKSNETGLRFPTSEGVHRINENLTIDLKMIGLEKWDSPGAMFNIIYFDAFSPDIQPELWHESVFQKMFHCLAPGGVLVTYCVKGAVVRAFKAAGFSTEKLAGPPGKRHVLRALKII